MKDVDFLFWLSEAFLFSPVVLMFITLDNIVLSFNQYLILYCAFVFSGFYGIRSYHSIVKERKLRKEKK